MGSDGILSDITILAIVVSIHAPAWGATSPHWVMLIPKQVSIHAPAWGATPEATEAPAEPESFNPRSRVGSDTQCFWQRAFSIRFQSTLPRGERPQQLFYDAIDAIGFNPRSRVGSDYDITGFDNYISRFNPRSRVGSDELRGEFLRAHRGVSIHAPAWGATVQRVAAKITRRFQSTLPRGERPGVFGLHTETLQFQSTLPRGERLVDPPLTAVTDNVSIHAPAWGATTRCSHDSHTPVFQSTLPRGERLCAPTIAAGLLCFNPRSRVGSDSICYPTSRGKMGFNPRSCVGSDLATTFIWLMGMVSIHAPAWGATRCFLEIQHHNVVSIHAPAWGATQKPNAII